MSKTNEALTKSMADLKAKEQLVAANAIEKPDTTNIQGYAAHSVSKWHRLLSMLNTLKLEPQYYRSQTTTLVELSHLIKECALEDLYFTCQCIVYSRCLGEGMRTISHAASVFIAPYISGQTYAQRFYGLWNKKEKQGGVIYRPDDMLGITEGFNALNSDKNTKLTNAMKKGFKSALETLDGYSLLKYKNKLIDIINLTHPSSEKSGATVEFEGETVYVLDAIMKGLSVSADTWEANQSEAGQIVAKAQREGKIDSQEAEKLLTEAKSANWKELLDNNKLGILAAIRNLRNILKNNPDSDTIDKLAKLVSNPVKIKEGKIFPYQLDFANEVLITEFSGPYSRTLSQALLKGYQLAIPNLAELLPGNNLVILDCSGSMYQQIYITGKNRIRSNTSALHKAGLIAATIAKGTNADIIRFGSHAAYTNYNPNTDVFTLAEQLRSQSFGGTNLSIAWNEAVTSGRTYDRVFILSDNEVNRGNSYAAYKSYVEKVGDPYVYSVDLAAYGTTVLAGPKVRYYYGYGLSMFDDVATSEFNPDHHIEKVKQVVI